MRPFFLSLLLLSLLLPSCEAPQPAYEYELYFLVDSDRSHGPAIQSETYRTPSPPSVSDLVQALLRGPTQSNLRSPFPKGLTIQSWSLESGLLTLNLSEQYGGLTDISLTLADYCFVLTLVQLDGVEELQIQSLGHISPTRRHPILSPEQVLWNPSQIPLLTTWEKAVQ